MRMRKAPAATPGLFIGNGADINGESLAGRCRGPVSNVEPHALSQRQLPPVVDRVGGPARIGFPGIGASFATSASLLFATECAADFRSRGSDVHVGDSAVRACCRDELFRLALIERRPDRQSAHWIYSLRVQQRDGFVKRMAEAGITAGRVHDRKDTYTATRESVALLPGMDRIADEIISIPTGWWVTEEDREHIAATVRAGW